MELGKAKAIPPDTPLLSVATAASVAGYMWATLPNFDGAALMLEHGGSRWWLNQIMSFMARPNQHSLDALIRPTVRETFAPFRSPDMPADAVPLRFVDLFMRGGDKWHEGQGTNCACVRAPGLTHLYA